MELKKTAAKVKELAGKYKYAGLVLLLGLVLLWLPGNGGTNSQTEPVSTQATKETVPQEEALAELLQCIQGAGRVKVLLSTAAGEETLYQTDSHTTAGSDSRTSESDTVIVTDSQRNESGLVRQVNPPVYLGAVVVCDGADNATVRLAITQAISKFTGLGADAICVLKMK